MEFKYKNNRKKNGSIEDQPSHQIMIKGTKNNISDNFNFKIIIGNV